MKILKFGGTSVGSPDSINKVVRIILNEKKNSSIAVVVSAFSGITNQLIELYDLAWQQLDYQELFQKIMNRHNNKPRILFDELVDHLKTIKTKQKKSLADLDLIMSFGERLSAGNIADIFNEHGIKSECLDARQLVKTNSDYGQAQVKIEETYQNIRNYFIKHKDLQIITGFIGSTDDNQTTTLGRGSSDYTASLFAAALSASAIEIWTDVDGIMTADPNKSASAKTIDLLSYDEAKKMADTGAKVLFPLAIIPAKQFNIPIYIKNTFHPHAAGTIINS